MEREKLGYKEGDSIGALGSVSADRAFQKLSALCRCDAILQDVLSPLPNINDALIAIGERHDDESDRFEQAALAQILIFLEKGGRFTIRRLRRGIQQC